MIEVRRIEMLQSRKNNHNIIFIVILCLICVVFVIIFINNLRNNDKDSSTSEGNAIYCKTENSPTDKIEIYFDFKDGAAYRYTIVTTSPLKKDFDKEKYDEFILGLNLKHKGLMSKIWYEEDTYTITEVFDLDRLTEDEMNNLTGISKKELKSQSRDKIKKTIVPIVAQGMATAVCIVASVDGIFLWHYARLYGALQPFSRISAECHLGGSNLHDGRACQDFVRLAIIYS